MLDAVQDAGTVITFDAHVTDQGQTPGPLTSINPARVSVRYLVGGGQSVGRSEMGEETKKVTEERVRKRKEREREREREREKERERERERVKEKEWR